MRLAPAPLVSVSVRANRPAVPSASGWPAIARGARLGGNGWHRFHTVVDHDRLPPCVTGDS